MENNDNALPPYQANDPEIPNPPEQPQPNPEAAPVPATPPPPPNIAHQTFMEDFARAFAQHQVEMQNTLNLLTQFQHAQLQGQHMQQLQQQQQAPLGGLRSLRVKEPRTFSGKRDELQPFLSELKNAITLQRGALVTDNDKALYMNAFLKKPGPPDSWWNGIEKAKPYLLEDFDGLLQDFVTHFQDPDLRATKQRELDNLVQKGSTSNYAARFLELCTYLNLTDETQCDYFKRGLKHEVHRGIAFVYPPPSNLDTLIHLAIQIDNSLYAVDAAKKPSTSTSKSTRQSNTFSSNSSGNYRGTPSNATVPMEIDAVKHKPLTNAERERRRKDNLCLYCGNAGHRVLDCPELAKKPKKEKIASSSSDAKGKGKPEDK